MLELRHQPSHADRVVAQEISGSLVLMRLPGGQYYGLNELGGRIWALCDGTRTVAEIIETIRREYDAPADRIRDDVLALMRELTDEQLLDSGNGAEAGR